jgi:hypothetical protein
MICSGLQYSGTWERDKRGCRHKQANRLADERHQEKNKAIKLTDSVKNYISEKLKEYWSVVSFVIQFLDYQNSDFKSIYIDLTLIADITLVFLLLWYAVSSPEQIMGRLELNKKIKRGFYLISYLIYTPHNSGYSAYSIPKQ